MEYVPPCRDSDLGHHEIRISTSPAYQSGDEGVDKRQAVRAGISDKDPVLPSRLSRPHIVCEADSGQPEQILLPRCDDVSRHASVNRSSQFPSLDRLVRPDRKGMGPFTLWIQRPAHSMCSVPCNRRMSGKEFRERSRFAKKIFRHGLSLSLQYPQQYEYEVPVSSCLETSE